MDRALVVVRKHMQFSVTFKTGYRTIPSEFLGTNPPGFWAVYPCSVPILTHSKAD